IYDRDTTAGKSSCNGNCATNWPPLMAAADAKADGAWTVITRDDGGKQWAYKGKPLYFWKDDKKAGDAEGGGRNNTRHIAAPWPRFDCTRYLTCGPAAGVAPRRRAISSWMGCAPAVSALPLSVSITAPGILRLGHTQSKKRKNSSSAPQSGR